MAKPYDGNNRQHRNWVNIGSKLAQNYKLPTTQEIEEENNQIKAIAKSLADEVERCWLRIQPSEEVYSQPQAIELEVVTTKIPGQITSTYHPITPAIALPEKAESLNDKRVIAYNPAAVSAKEQNAKTLSVINPNRLLNSTPIISTPAPTNAHKELPKDVKYYFAYGSNLNEDDLKRWCGKWKDFPYIRKVGNAFLPDMRLAFNAKSGSRGGGVANIIPSKGDVVPGVIFAVESKGIDNLDIKEGCYRSTYNYGNYTSPYAGYGGKFASYGKDNNSKPTPSEHSGQSYSRQDYDYDHGYGDYSSGYNSYPRGKSYAEYCGSIQRTEAKKEEPEPKVPAWVEETHKSRNLSQDPLFKFNGKTEKEKEEKEGKLLASIYIDPYDSDGDAYSDADTDYIGVEAEVEPSNEELEAIEAESIFVGKEEDLDFQDFMERFESELSELTRDERDEQLREAKKFNPSLLARDTKLVVEFLVRALTLLNEKEDDKLATESFLDDNFWYDTARDENSETPFIIWYDENDNYHEFNTYEEYEYYRDNRDEGELEYYVNGWGRQKMDEISTLLNQGMCQISDVNWPKNHPNHRDQISKRKELRENKEEAKKSKNSKKEEFVVQQDNFKPFVAPEPKSTVTHIGIVNQKATLSPPLTNPNPNPNPNPTITATTPSNYSHHNNYKPYNSYSSPSSSVKSEPHGYKQIETYAILADGSGDFIPVYTYQFKGVSADAYVEPTKDYARLIIEGYKAHGLMDYFGCLKAAALNKLENYPRIVDNVFVYGSLLSGLGNYRVSNHKICFKATISGYEMYDLGSFPCIAQNKSTKKTIVGEMIPRVGHCAENSWLERLDGLEGFNGYERLGGNHYCRTIVSPKVSEGVLGRLAWTYVYLYKRGAEMDHGDWRKHHEESDRYSGAQYSHSQWKAYFEESDRIDNEIKKGKRGNARGCSKDTKNSGLVCYDSKIPIDFGQADNLDSINGNQAKALVDLDILDLPGDQDNAESNKPDFPSASKAIVTEKVNIVKAGGQGAIRIGDEWFNEEDYDVSPEEMEELRERIRIG